MKIRTIKKLFSISLLSLLPVLAYCAPGQPATNTVPIYFAWPNQPAVSNVVYRVYWSTTLNTPTNQWPLFAMISNPTLVGNQLTFTNTTGVVPGIYFFTMTLSNFWIGETFFSDAAITGGSPGVIPSPVQNFNVAPVQSLK